MKLFRRRKKQPAKALIGEIGPEAKLQEFRIAVKVGESGDPQAIVDALRQWTRKHGPIPTAVNTTLSSEPIERDVAPGAIEIKTPDGRFHRYYRLDVIGKYLQRRYPMGGDQ